MESGGTNWAFYCVSCRARVMSTEARDAHEERGCCVRRMSPSEFWFRDMYGGDACGVCHLPAEAHTMFTHNDRQHSGQRTLLYAARGSDSSGQAAALHSNTKRRSAIR